MNALESVSATYNSFPRQAPDVEGVALQLQHHTLQSGRCLHDRFPQDGLERTMVGLHVNTLASETWCRRSISLASISQFESNSVQHNVNARVANGTGRPCCMRPHPSPDKKDTPFQFLCWPIVLTLNGAGQNRYYCRHCINEK